MAGYSGTPLRQKLGIRPSARLLVINQPPSYRQLLGKLPKGARFVERPVNALEFIHLFTTSRDELKLQLKLLRSKLSDTGTIWVSWPKRSAGLSSDVNENTVRELALLLGLVDTKVCAVDDVWSALKLMVRRRNRRMGETH